MIDFVPYIINLKSRPDRKSLAEQEASSFFDRFCIIEATDSCHFDLGSQRKNSEAACRDSHFRLLKYILQNRIENALILEDDFYFDQNAPSLQSYLEAIPNDYQWLYFGINHQFGPTRVNDRWSKVIRGSTTHAYHLKIDIIPVILANIEARKDLPIDLIYSDLQCIFNTYSCNPNLILQRAGFSDIVGENTDYFFMKNS